MLHASYQVGESDELSLPDLCNPTHRTHSASHIILLRYRGGMRNVQFNVLQSLQLLNLVAARGLVVARL